MSHEKLAAVLSCNEFILRWSIIMRLVTNGVKPKVKDGELFEEEE